MSDQSIILSVKLTAQNSNPRTLEVSSFTLTGGQWDPNAQPTAWQVVAPATTGCWIAITTVPPGNIQGSMDFLVAQAGTLQVTWDLNPNNPFEPQLINNLNNDAVAASLVVNQGDYMHVWVQLIISIVTTAQQGETLADIAVRFDTNEETLLILNKGFTSTTDLVAGQQVWVASPLPGDGGGPLDCSDS